MKRVLKWLGLGFVVLIIGLIAPVGYIELACRPSGQVDAYTPILPPEDHRAEGRTLLTYPEWHIVHAYDDYAAVIENDDPHAYNYASAIAGFWTSLCSLSDASGPHGGFPSAFKQTIYTIGVSFTAELLAKAAYEETLGRAATWIRGPSRSLLDDLSAQQAREYSRFLQQVPWYKWDFTADRTALNDTASADWRDRERRLSLGLEYAVKTRYARVIAAAVANMEPDALQLRMIITDMTEAELSTFPGVRIVQTRPEGIEIETPRYRELTTLLLDMASAGANFTEIAGNDDIMFTLISDTPNLTDALHSFARQGYQDHRHLMLVDVPNLAQTLRQLGSQSIQIEHIHDY